MENFDLKKYLAENKLVKEDDVGDDKDHKHTYKQIDPDGTAECTKCGLRNSDPSKTGESKLNESSEDGSQYHIDQIDDDLSYMVGNIDGYLDNIIAGIEELRISYKENMDGDSFDPDREYDDEFSSGGTGAGFDHSPHDL